MTIFSFRKMALCDLICGALEEHLLTYLLTYRCIVCVTIQMSEICDFRVSPFCQVVQKHKLFEVAG